MKCLKRFGIKLQFWKHSSERLAYNIFIFYMASNQVQEKLCTEPNKTSREALQLAIAFEDGLEPQKLIGQPSSSMKIKKEPLCAVIYKSKT